MSTEKNMVVFVIFAIVSFLGCVYNVALETNIYQTEKSGHGQNAPGNCALFGWNETGIFSKSSLQTLNIMINHWTWISAYEDISPPIHLEDCFRTKKDGFTNQFVNLNNMNVNPINACRSKCTNNNNIYLSKHKCYCGSSSFKRNGYQNIFNDYRESCSMSTVTHLQCGEAFDNFCQYGVGVGESTQYVSVTLWGKKNPSAGSQHKCVSIKTSSDGDMIFRSTKCTEIHPYLCIGSMNKSRSSFNSTVSSVSNTTSNEPFSTLSDTFSSAAPSVTNNTPKGTISNRISTSSTNSTTTASAIKTTTLSETTQHFNNKTINTQRYTATVTDDTISTIKKSGLQDSTDKNDSSLNKVNIVSGVVVGLILISGLIIGVYVFRRRRKGLKPGENADETCDKVYENSTYIDHNIDRVENNTEMRNECMPSNGNNFADNCLDTSEHEENDYYSYEQQDSERHGCSQRECDSFPNSSGDSFRSTSLNTENINTDTSNDDYQNTTVIFDASPKTIARENVKQMEMNEQVNDYDHFEQENANIDGLIQLTDEMYDINVNLTQMNKDLYDHGQGDGNHRNESNYDTGFHMDAIEDSYDQFDSKDNTGRAETINHNDYDHFSGGHDDDYDVVNETKNN